MPSVSLRKGELMNIWHVILLVAGMGALGGIINCAIAGEFVLPQFDKATGVWRPGWIGNVLVGLVAALVVWGANGPHASLDIVKVLSQSVPLTFTLANLVSSIVIGLGGGNILTQMAKLQAERSTRRALASALKDA